MFPTPHHFVPVCGVKDHDFITSTISLSFPCWGNVRSNMIIEQSSTFWYKRGHLKAQGVHLEQHLDGEEDDEEHVCDLLEVLEPLWLVVVLGGEDAGVEQHQDDDEPEHRLRLDSSPAVPPRLAVPPAAKHDFSENILLELSTGLCETSQRLEKAPSTAFSLLKAPTGV